MKTKNSSTTLSSVSPTTPTDDSQILALFREWMISARHEPETGDHDDWDCPGCERTYEIADKIIEIPAVGLAGFVIKTYLFLYDREGGTFKDACVIWRPRGYASDPILTSVLRDAARFVSELEPLVTAFFETERLAAGHAEPVGLGELQEGGAR